MAYLLRRIIRDFDDGTLRQVNVANYNTLQARNPNKFRVLHSSLYMEEQSSFVSLDVRNDIVNFQSAAPADANAQILFFEDRWNTIATITRSNRIVIAPQFSGCLYSVYYTPTGDYICVHTARPDGSDAYVQALQLYAQSMRWTLLHAIPTRADGTSGVGIGGCTITFFVTRVSYTVTPKPIARTVRVRADAQWRAVRTDRYDTPTP